MSLPLAVAPGQLVRQAVVESFVSSVLKSLCGFCGTLESGDEAEISLWLQYNRLESAPVWNGQGEVMARRGDVLLPAEDLVFPPGAGEAACLSSLFRSGLPPSAPLEDWRRSIGTAASACGESVGQDPPSGPAWGSLALAGVRECRSLLGEPVMGTGRRLCGGTVTA